MAYHAIAYIEHGSYILVEHMDWLLIDWLIDSIFYIFYCRIAFIITLSWVSRVSQSMMN